MTRLNVWNSRAAARIWGFGGTVALVLGGLSLGVTTEAFAAPADPLTVQPTLSEIEFIETPATPDYTEGGAVDEVTGNEQQRAVVSRQSGGADEINIARADLDTDNALVAVTWDASAVAPESVQLRYLLEGTWSEWIDLGIETGQENPRRSATARAGTAPFGLFYADSVEVVARSSDGTPIPGLALNIIDGESQGDIENALLPIAESIAPDSPVEGPESEVVEEEVAEADLTEDALLDLEGAASVDGVSYSLGLAPFALNTAGTEFDTGFAGLKINTRKGWGADESLMTWTPKENKIQGAVVHHTESSNNYTADQVAQQIRNIYQYHAVTLDWGDIGYNLIVDKFGGVWEGRAGGLTRQIHAAHAGNANGTTVGVVMLGSFMEAAPVAAAQDALAKTVAWKLQLHGVTSVKGTTSVLHEDGKLRDVPVVSGHRDVSWTDCPGDALYPTLGALRTAVAKYIDGSLGSGSGSGSGGGAGTGVTPDLPVKNVLGLPEVFTAGNVISDALFYNSAAMNTAQIKSFIETTGKDCQPGTGTTCLKDTTFPTVNLTTLRGGCKPLNLSGTHSPWTIISETAKACGINPQVILTTLQKEQSGLTQPKSAATWAKAMGSGCPDSNACDPAQGGFEKQVYYGADKLVSYRLQSQADYVDAFKAGRSVTVPNNPAESCGSQTFKFDNVASASLYEYTPYIGGSSVSGCAAIGQKSFHNIYKRYFPQTIETTTALAAPVPVVSGVPFVGVTLAMSGAGATSFTPAATSVKYQWMRDGAPIAGATGTSYTLTTADLGKRISVWASGSRTGYTSATGVSANLIPRGTVTRLAGSNRVATNVAVNTETMEAGRPLFIATAQEYADALSVGPAVSVSGGSLMLTNPSSLSADNLNLMKSRKPSHVYIIGGTKSVSESVVGQVEAAVPGVAVTRVAGTDRYSTSTVIAEKFFGSRSITTALIATGRDYPDALTASSAGGALAAPVILVNGAAATELTPGAAAFLAQKKPGKVVVVGGINTLSSSLETNLRKSYPGTVRVSGGSRYATNMAINDYLSQNGGTAPTGIWVATGLNYPDALSAAVPAGAANQRLVLSNGKCLPKPVVSSWISPATSKVTSVRLIGGSSSISESMMNLPECP